MSICLCNMKLSISAKNKLERYFGYMNFANAIYYFLLHKLDKYYVGYMKDPHRADGDQ